MSRPYQCPHDDPDHTKSTQKPSENQQNHVQVTQLAIVPGASWLLRFTANQLCWNKQSLLCLEDHETRAVTNPTSGSLFTICPVSRPYAFVYPRYLGRKWDALNHVVSCISTCMRAMNQAIDHCYMGWSLDRVAYAQPMNPSRWGSTGHPDDLWIDLATKLAKLAMIFHGKWVTQP